MSRGLGDVYKRQVQPGYWRWDWCRHRRAEWVPLEPGKDLVVEGVGAVTESSIRAARMLGDVNTIWVSADEHTRKARALARDPGYVLWWQMWARQEAALEKMPVDVEVMRRPG